MLFHTAGTHFDLKKKLQIDTVFINLYKESAMTTAAIREKLQKYIQQADEKKIKAIFTMVENDLNELDWKSDDALIAELDRRSKEYRDGKVKGISWETARKRILTPTLKGDLC